MARLIKKLKVELLKLNKINIINRYNIAIPSRRYLFVPFRYGGQHHLIISLCSLNAALWSQKYKNSNLSTLFHLILLTDYSNN